MKIETNPESEKQAQMLKLLQFGTVMVFIDSRQESVLVPSHLKGDYQLRLNFDYAYEVNDFRVLPDRLEASLSFNKNNFFCVIPYKAMYLAISHSIQHGVLFTQSIPVEMLEYFAEEARMAEKGVKQAKRQAALSVISDSSSFAVDSNLKDPVSKQKKKSKKKRHLRLIK